MTKCEKCDTWMLAGNLCSACLSPFPDMRAKVAKHKDPDYLLAKAAWTVLQVLNPKTNDPAYKRCEKILVSICGKNKALYLKAYSDTKHLTPRRRGQDNRPVSRSTDYGK